MDKQLEISEKRDLEAEINAIAEEQSRLTPKQRESIALKAQIKQDKIDAENEAIHAAEMAEIKQKEEAKLLALKIKEEKAAAEKLAQEKLEAELADLTRKQEEQQVAWDAYIGTKYDTLELKDGKILKEAKATEVRATHVTFVHSTGIANVQFKDLSYAIRRVCKYDPELAEHSAKKQAELQRQIKSRLAAAAARDAEEISNTETKTTYTAPSSTDNSTITAPNYDNVIPRGNVSIKTIGTRNNRNYRLGSSKTIEASAISNVPAALTIGGISYELTPNIKLVRTHTSYDGKYEVTLRDKKGRILDKESHNRKTGL